MRWAKHRGGIWHRLINPVDRDVLTLKGHRASRSVCGVMVSPADLGDQPGINVCRRCMMSRR
jgi:hypothetical protein